MSRPRPLVLPTPVVPVRSDRMAYDRQLIIDPTGKAYFVNRFRKQFHWRTSSLGGYDIILAQHQGINDYIDFSDDDASDPRLYHYTQCAEKQPLNFDIKSLSCYDDNDDAYALLEDELRSLYPDEAIEVEEVDQTPFCLDFQHGTEIQDEEDTGPLDYMCVVRLDLMIKHKSWSLFFSVFEAHEPCACGVPYHTTMSFGCSTLSCRVATARTYEEFQRLTRPIHLPPQETTIVYLQTRSIIGRKTIYEARLEGTLPVTAEEAPDFNVDAYRQHPSLNTHPNILSFHGHTVSQSRLYRLFSHYEHTLFHEIAIEKMEHVSGFDLKQWVGDIVEGLRFLHAKGLHHGSVYPPNIVLLGRRALLHGMTTSGSQQDDITCLAALLFHLFTRGSCFGKYSYIPTMELCNEQLKNDPEANDLVQGLLSGRLSLDQVMMQPRFWHARKALDFIKLVSDRVQDQAHKRSRNRVDHLLELALKKIEGEVYAYIQEEPGSKGMPKRFLWHSFEHGVREFGSNRNVAALIRSFRNRFGHILEQRDEDKVLNDSISLMKAISAGYPKLVLLFKNLPSRIREEPEFQRYY